MSSLTPRLVVGLVKGAISLARAVPAKFGAFAKKYPRIATAIRVGLMVTGTALAIAASVATGGAAGVFIGTLAVGAMALKAREISRDHADLTQTRDPVKRDLAARRVGNGIMFGAVGVVAASLGVAGITHPATAASKALSELGSEFYRRAKKVL